jgi:hypothetical protein
MSAVLRTYERFYETNVQEQIATELQMPSNVCVRGLCQPTNGQHPTSKMVR